jgi:hypothetical protein
MRRASSYLAGLALAASIFMSAGCGSSVDESAPAPAEEKNKFEKSTGVQGQTPAADSQETTKTD